MSNPLAFGFMPMNQALGYNWEQSPRDPSSYDVQAGVLEALRRQSQQRFHHSPFGPSFERRFDALSPIQNEMDMPGVKTGQGIGPAEEARMLTALESEARKSPGTSFMSGMAGAGEDLLQYSGNLGNQPWLDEYIAANKAGADTPVMQRMGGRGLNETEQAGIASRRKERLAKTSPALSLDERKQNVMQKAQAKSEQRDVRMGEMSPMESQMRALERMQGGGGFGGMDLAQLAMLGPDAYARLMQVQQQGDEMAWKQGLANDPRMIWANAGAQAGTGMDLPGFVQQWGGRGSAESAATIYERSAGDWEKYKVMAHAAGMSGQETLDSWARFSGEQRGGPTQPGMFDSLFDPNRSLGRKVLGNYLADSLGIQ